MEYLGFHVTLSTLNYILIKAGIKQLRLCLQYATAAFLYLMYMLNFNI